MAQFFDLLGFVSELIQRHHRRHAFVLITALAREMNAAPAGRAFLCACAAKVDRIIRGDGCGSRAAVRAARAAIRERFRIHRRIGQWRICSAMDDQRRRRGPKITAECKGSHCDNGDHDEWFRAPAAQSHHAVFALRAVKHRAPARSRQSCAAIGAEVGVAQCGSLQEAAGLYQLRPNLPVRLRSLLSPFARNLHAR